MTAALALVVREAQLLVVAIDGRAHLAAHAIPGRPDAGEREQGPILTQRESGRRHLLGVRCSQNEVAGTMQRLPVRSHRLQSGTLLTFRMCVIGAPPN